jgi:exodeoxyribonuclease V alpha subunit
MSLPQATQNRLADLLAKARAQKAISSTLAELTEAPVHTESINTLTLNNDLHTTDRFGKTIQYNEEQLQFVNLAKEGTSAILIGAAGTGKTTCMKGVVSSLIQSGYAGILHSDGHKHLLDGAPGIVAVSFTRRAVSNLRRAMPEDMKQNCLTIHALLEYEPQYYTIIDETTGDERNTMRFEPTRTISRPLPSTIRTCIIDESSMVSVELFKELQDALPQNTQFIFLGDIQQLPPVFGSAILGYKMLELPTVELTQVYRQALESPIIRLAHRILSGKPIPADEYPEWKFPGQLTIHPWKKKLSAEWALMTMAKFLTTAIENNAYDPYNDMVLIPFNKACGTIELNNHIANFLARRDKRITYEIIAGFNKLYLSVGDKVLYDKEDAVITDIKLNASYTGASPQASSESLDYWGFNHGEEHKSKLSEEDQNLEDDIDFLLSQSVALSGSEGEDRVRQASHCVTVKMADTGTEVTIDSAADLNALILSYALTVHKSQGSEWRKVFLMLHQSHATMLQRELLYTAVTRAKEELYVICEPETFVNGIKSQRIKGNTLAEKAEFFKGKVITGGIK